jgi:hypothetical protein
MRAALSRLSPPLQNAPVTKSSERQSHMRRLTTNHQKRLEIAEAHLRHLLKRGDKNLQVKPHRQHVRSKQARC